MSGAEGRVDARITPEQIDAMRARIGYAAGHTYKFHDVATADAIRHFAIAIGDDNPLWCDPGYAPRTRWRSTIAPPMFYMCMGDDESPALPPDVKQRVKGALSGVHLFHAGTEVEWGGHVHVGDRLFYRGVFAGLDVKESEFAGQSLVEHRHLTWTNQRGQDVVFQHETFIRTERRTAAGRDKFARIEEARYTDEDLAAIDAAYARERPRGAEVLWWEDVAVGDEIPGVVKGPLCVTDIISMHIGWGWGGYDIAPYRLAWKHRQRMPGFWQKDRRGAWDVAQRLHWEEDWAREVGVPLRYDYGFMRTAWMMHAVTDWMGDDAFLWKFWNRFTRFNFIGDTTWVRGVVVDRSDADGLRSVTLELRCVDQRGEETAVGGATVLLASRARGRVVVPPLAERANG